MKKFLKAVLPCSIGVTVTIILSLIFGLGMTGLILKTEAQEPQIHRIEFGDNRVYTIYDARLHVLCYVARSISSTSVDCISFDDLTMQGRAVLKHAIRGTNKDMIMIEPKPEPVGTLNKNIKPKRSDIYKDE